MRWAVTGSYLANVTVYYSDGKFPVSFAPGVSVSEGSVFYMQPLDANGDGRMDLLTTNPLKSQILLRLNMGGSPVTFSIVELDHDCAGASSVGTADVRHHHVAYRVCRGPEHTVRQIPKRTAAHACPPRVRHVLSARAVGVMTNS